MNIIKPHELVSANYAKSSIESKENTLMMQCKQQCMSIIQLILDYDLDLSIRSTCQFFQKFEMPEKQKSIKAESSLL